MFPIAKTLFVVVVGAIAAAAVPLDARQQPGGSMPVFTATRVYQTITDVPPYIVTATTTMTWTCVPSSSPVPFLSPSSSASGLLMAAQAEP
ncbi:hypothetical protein FB451DRAFT_1406499 [Mycena latifolia]|nr:hypothetical protein FB451DRAFT_1406499 [Mycena latifolia]